VSFVAGLTYTANLCASSEIGLCHQAQNTRADYVSKEGNLLKSYANIGFNKWRLVAVKIAGPGRANVDRGRQWTVQTVRTKRKVQLLYLKKRY